MSPQGRRGSGPAAGLEVSTVHRKGEGRTKASTWRSSIARQREGVAYLVVVGAHVPGKLVMFATWY